MDEKDNIAVNVRKLQEETENLVKAGFHNELAKWHWALYQAYMNVGFKPHQALKLINASINKP